MTGKMDSPDKPANDRNVNPCRGGHWPPVGESTFYNTLSSPRAALLRR
jgi:hypothetical protein